MVYIKNFFIRIWEFIIWPYDWYKERQRIKKRLEQLKKEDPLIYD